MSKTNEKDKTTATHRRANADRANASTSNNLDKGHNKNLPTDKGQQGACKGAVNEFTILGNPISKKNSQQILTNRKTGRPFIMPSKQYKKFEAGCQEYISPLPSPIDYPVNLCCTYYMQTRRKCDLVNMIEATQDILVKYGVLKDDNCSVIRTNDGSTVLYDKENPRTEVIITPKTDRYADWINWKESEGE